MEEVFARGGQETELADYLDSCTRLLRERAGSAISHWTVNAGPKVGAISIELLVRPGQELEPFASNCAYLGFDARIVCDAEFVFGTSRVPSPSSPSPVDGLAFNIGKAVAMWVLGHEVGHIAHGHSGGHFRFEGEAFTRIRVGESRFQQMEMEADAFAVDAVRSARQALTMILVANLVVDAQAEERGVRLGSGLVEIPYDPNATHPPLIVRALSVRRLLLRRYDLAALVRGGAGELEPMDVEDAVRKYEGMEVRLVPKGLTQ